MWFPQDSVIGRNRKPSLCGDDGHPYRIERASIKTLNVNVLDMNQLIPVFLCSCKLEDFNHFW